MRTRRMFGAGCLMRTLCRRQHGIGCLPSTAVSISTPTGADVEGVAVEESRVCAVSIVRGGDAFLEQVRACLPQVAVGKILIQRDESSADKHPVLFYQKLPPRIAEMQVILCDPMLATGGSAKMAISCLKDAGVPETAIVFATVVVCPEGLAALAAEHPEVTVVTGAVDEGLDERKYIVPGLGDFGDRFYGTVG